MIDRVAIEEESTDVDATASESTLKLNSLGGTVAVALSLVVLVSLTTSRDGSLSSEERARVAAVTLGAEHGDTTPQLRKWTTSIRLAVRGEPSESDTIEMLGLVAELRELVHPLPIILTDQNPNFTVHFVPEVEMSHVLPEYRPGNEGYCWARWNDRGGIESATVLISTDNEHETFRHHLIREEVTQCLGPLRDSCSDPESIFYCRYSETTEYSPMDRVVIRAIYDPRVPTQATAPTLEAALRRLDW